MTPAKLPAGIRAHQRVQQAMELLLSYPQGLPITDIAGRLGVPDTQLLDDIIAFYATDLGPHQLLGLTRPHTIEFLADGGSEAEEPSDAVLLRLASRTPESELGVAFLSVSDLDNLYAAANALLEVEPHNEVLARARQRLGEAFLAQDSAEREDAPEGARQGDTVGELQRAIDGCRVVRLAYSRAWEPGVVEPELEPHRLIRTQRGWELDARKVQDGAPRTYLVQRIRAVEVQQRTFEPSAAILRQLDDDRAPVSIDLVMPHRTLWVVDRFAEATEVMASDDDDFEVRASLLPPVAERVGVILAIAGPGAFPATTDETLQDGGAVRDSGMKLARRLLAHHGLAGTEG